MTAPDVDALMARVEDASKMWSLLSSEATDLDALLAALREAIEDAVERAHEAGYSRALDDAIRCVEGSHRRLRAMEGSDD